MKKLLVLLMVLAMLFSVGCFAVPEEDPEPVVNIVCEGGHYSVRYTEWSPTGCEGNFYSAGTFWVNDDGRTFLLGDVVSVEELWDMYGDCPTEFVEEILFE